MVHFKHHSGMRVQPMHELVAVTSSSYYVSLDVFKRTVTGLNKNITEKKNIKFFSIV